MAAAHGLLELLRSSSGTAQTGRGAARPGFALRQRRHYQRRPAGSDGREVAHGVRTEDNAGERDSCLHGSGAILDIDQLELQSVAADHVEGWDVAPGKIAFSHSGYTTGSSKSAIASDLAAHEFSVINLQTGQIVL